MKLALKFKNFPAPTAIFKDFQGACEPCVFFSRKSVENGSTSFKQHFQYKFPGVNGLINVCLSKKTVSLCNNDIPVKYIE